MGMFRDLKVKLFGEWERIASGKGTVGCGGLLTSDYETDAVMIVERNTKTGEHRAYVKTPFGHTQSVDMDFVRQMLKEKGYDGIS